MAKPWSDYTYPRPGELHAERLVPAVSLRYVDPMRPVPGEPWRRTNNHMELVRLRDRAVEALARYLAECDAGYWRNLDRERAASQERKATA